MHTRATLYRPDMGAGFLVNSTLPLPPDAVKPVLESTPAYDYRTAIEHATTFEDIQAVFALVFPAMQSSTRILHTFPNAEDGVAAIVAKVDQGYSVVLKDTDADEIAQAAKIFSDEAQAVGYAKLIAGGKLITKPTISEMASRIQTDDFDYNEDTEDRAGQCDSCGKTDDQLLEVFNTRGKSEMYGHACPECIAVAHKEALKTYRYGFRSRPFGLGSQPDGWTAVDNEFKDPARRIRWGTIDYPFELTEKQVYDFELIPMGNVG